MTDTRALVFTLEIDGLDPAMHRVKSFEVTERLSEGCRAVVELESEEPIAVRDQLGKTARLVIGGDSTRDERCFHLVVRGARTRYLRPERFLTRFDLAARVELAGIGCDARIFQHKSVPDIVKQVLSGAGLPEDQQDWRVHTSYAEREYVTQFNESDYDFARRLLADEGIAFAVRNDAASAKVVFFDDDGGLEPIEGDAVLPDRASTAGRIDTVTDLRVRESAASDAVMLRDYDPTRPSLDLSSRESGDNSTGREVYQHPGGYLRPSDGTRRARRLLERLRCFARRFEGTTDCPYLEPGRTFSSEGYLRAELNAELFVTAVIHRGELPEADRDGHVLTYTNEFVAIPRDVPYRPAMETAAPVVGGVQVAFVTGPSGQELHGSERGEVRVRFPWDRSGVTDDRSSRWLRVGQLQLQGPMIVPRVGFEVIADFELGDNDRPFVTGHLYNGEAMPPYALPGGATRSSIQTNTTDGGGGANELRFEDSAGGEEIFINASRDYTASVEHDSETSAVVDESLSIGANHTVSVGANYHASVIGDRSLSIGGNQKVNVAADFSDGVGGSKSVSIGAMRQVTVGGDFTETTKGSLTRTIGGLQCVTGVAGCDRKVVGSSTTKVGAAWLEICAGSRSSKTGGARIETIGALKMVKAKSVSVSCGAAYALTCASESSKCGGDRTDKAMGAVAITAGGGLSVNATNINISGDSKVVLRVGGTSIEVTPTAVKIKSPSVDLKGVKALKSLAMHKSG